MEPVFDLSDCTRGIPPIESVFDLSDCTRCYSTVEISGNHACDDPVTGCHTHSLEVCIRLCAHFIYYACVEENDKCLAAFYLVFGICISCFQLVTLILHAISRAPPTPDEGAPSETVGRVDGEDFVDYPGV
ncbi:unnamed protein product [Trifolium pratense]|uniref:Uncharacterized protein n=2 Tax=Trifolium pratense TaxID=57577 RepID=A0ACB0JDX7_TRIPR|nr:unnamed protein product [Trifolium pratense]CAJ2641874.1 unnamed protein product [Trifolium pratense]